MISSVPFKRYASKNPLYRLVPSGLVTLRSRRLASRLIALPELVSSRYTGLAQSDGNVITDATGVSDADFTSQSPACSWISVAILR